MTIVCNIWMICLELNWFVYDPSWMLHLSEFVWKLRSSVLVVFNNFLLIDATDRSKISGDQKRFFYRIKPIPPFIFANTPFKQTCGYINCFNILWWSWPAGCRVNFYWGIKLWFSNIKVPTLEFEIKCSRFKCSTSD